MTEIYSSRAADFASQEKEIDRKGNTLTLLRLFTIIAAAIFTWFAFRTNNLFWIGAIAFIGGFLISVRFHSKNRNQKKLVSLLRKLNIQEQHYYQTGEPFAPNGAEFSTDGHFYTYDLDIFGQNSLFQHLNRTGTVMGKRRLAEALSRKEAETIILGRQQTTGEIQDEIKWRQQFQAKAMLSSDSETIYSTLRNWTSENTYFPPSLNYLRFILPALYPVLIGMYLFTDHMLFIHLLTTTFVINILVIASQWKKINAGISEAEKISLTLSNYGDLLEMIEKASFDSSYFSQIKQKLNSTGKPASEQLKDLASIFVRVESIQNGFGAILLNGTILYHIHAFRDLVIWKQKHAPINLMEWLSAIGDVEVLNSFANLRFNNPEFCFPEINDTAEIRFEELGHPMIFRSKRVDNDVDFTKQPFMILTGSNMSGKSTFLRTLGVNMVLANAGSAICAKSGTFQPLPILVSMRLSDSLNDSESYFFAEVKRLKEIMDNLEGQACFVLLDEILRGTNSDDKQSGTIGVIDKLRNQKAIGAIATHDLEVCQLAFAHPEQLMNNCFEVEIINDDLHFDYKLREGICRNKSATFLMTKMGII